MGVLSQTRPHTTLDNPRALCYNMKIILIFKRGLMETKHYNTAGREKLVAYLREHAADTPKSAEAIYAGLAEKGDAPGYSSVYRLLSKLVDEGTVRRVRVPAPAKGYLFQFADTHACHAHFHLHCLSCGDVLHLECHCSDEIASHLQKTHGFAVDRGQSVLYGLCAACAAKGV